MGFYPKLLRSVGMGAAVPGFLAWAGAAARSRPRMRIPRECIRSGGTRAVRGDVARGVTQGRVSHGEIDPPGGGGLPPIAGNPSLIKGFA